jgi:hypothetical protein
MEFKVDFIFNRISIYQWLVPNKFDCCVRGWIRTLDLWDRGPVCVVVGEDGLGL